MSDPLEQVLQLVADGRLTAEEAAPILDALGAATGRGFDAAPKSDAAEQDQPLESLGNRRASSIRIEVTEDGRKVVNLRVPVSLGRLALDRIPGLSVDNVDLVRQAMAGGQTGTLLVVDDGDGDGVRIALE